MSSILKALRKIETDKRLAERAVPHLAADQGAAPGKSGRLAALLAGMAIGGLVVGLLFYSWSPDAVPLTVEPSVPGQAEHAAPARTTPAAGDAGQLERAADAAAALNPMAGAAPAAAQLEPAPESAALPVVILPAQPLASGRAAPAAIAPQGTPRPVPQAAGKGVPAMVEKSAGVPPPALPDPAAPSLQPSTELPSGVTLLVSEIFYQDDGSDSMAVVNDLAVMVGSHVDSAVVTEILADRVRFKVADTIYTVVLTGP